MLRTMLMMLAGATVAVAAPTGSAEPVVPIVAPLGKAETLSVLTYNVQDLPWPAGTDRAVAFTRMAARLRSMQVGGAAPDIIVLQEGFTNGTAAMLRAAGYRHIVRGSDSDVARPVAASPLNARFLAERSAMKGEGFAPRLSSGLWIASRYPIVSAAAQPFPADACAGLDCLANKGMLLARVAVPGIDQPVEVVTSHLNAARKSRTATHHHLYAYRQQVAAMSAFLKATHHRGAMVVLAGDFNLGSSTDRLASFGGTMRAAGFAAVTAMGKAKDAPDCGRVGPCAGALPISPNVPLIHSLDWQLVRPGQGEQLAPLSRQLTFGVEPDGTMLSDHIGFTVRYRIERD